MGKKLRAAFCKGLSGCLWVITPFLEQLFAGWIVPKEPTSGVEEFGCSQAPLKYLTFPADSAPPHP